MIVTIHITTNAPGFQPAPQLELARIFRALAEKAERAPTVQDLDKLQIRDRDKALAGAVTVTR